MHIFQLNGTSLVDLEPFNMSPLILITGRSYYLIPTISPFNLPLLSKKLPKYEPSIRGFHPLTNILLPHSLKWWNPCQPLIWTIPHLERQKVGPF